jgi:hypothetical protein
MQLSAQHLSTKKQMAIAVVDLPCQVSSTGIVPLLSAKQRVPDFQK